jgi:tetratricopeptide (TPR) repeat protein
MRAWPVLIGFGICIAAASPARAEPDAFELPPGFPPDLFRAPFELGPDWRPYPQGLPPPVSRRERKESAPARKPPSATQEQSQREAEAAERAAALKKAMAPQPSPSALRQQKLDALFERLKNAPDAETAKAIAASIEELWLKTPSDTASLLMQRAFLAVTQNHYPLALSILDKIIALEPDWAEAFNRRATTRFMADDIDGAMSDIERALKLEPRHFGALAGMGVILRREGFAGEALEAFKRALALHPQQPDLQALVERLTIEVEGQDI